jgi:hypothetical protein
VEVHCSARKHGVKDADMAHAVTHYVYAEDLENEEPGPRRVLYLGPDRAGNPLEIVVIERDDGTELTIHAMKMRTSYEYLIWPGR